MSLLSQAFQDLIPWGAGQVGSVGGVGVLNLVGDTETSLVRLALLALPRPLALLLGIAAGVGRARLR